VVHPVVCLQLESNPKGTLSLWRYTQIIKEDNRPVAVIIDYKEYMRLMEIEEDKADYYSAIKVKQENKKWTGHNDLKASFSL